MYYVTISCKGPIMLGKVTLNIYKISLWGCFHIGFETSEKIGGNHAFFRDNKASTRKKNVIYCFVYYCFFGIIVA